MNNNKFLTTLVVIALIFILVLAVYIWAGVISSDSNLDRKFNKDKEIEFLNDNLSEVGSSLGVLVLMTGIDNSNSNRSFKLEKNIDLLENEENRQLFVMEYILTYQNNYDKFIVLDSDEKVVLSNAVPTDSNTIAYLKYEDFNFYYNKLFGNDFNLSDSIKGNTLYDAKYVYYPNKRNMLDGLYVPMISALNIKYEDNYFVADVKVYYSEMIRKIIGYEYDMATLIYSKNGNGDMLLNSFVLN